MSDAQVATTTQAKKRGEPKAKKVVAKPVKRVSARLYSRGVILGYKRSLVKQYRHTSLLRIEGVQDKKDTKFYLGKRVAYLYTAKTKKTGPNTYKGKRVIWGRIADYHGNSGVVKAKFSPQLPPSSIGQPVRVFLFPSNV
ncbi:ribosomal protein L33 [Acrasis kona]|uniref:Ribosomal protein L33 n=1 Tax=Acrasis kona TaxID=1008807 RepID=A0AAW2Z8X1_9EUKA